MINIWIADDDKNILDRLKNILDRENYIVETFIKPEIIRGFAGSITIFDLNIGRCRYANCYRAYRKH